MTLRQGIRVLEREGLVDLQRGAGTYVAPNRLTKQQEFRSFTDEILNLSIGLFVANLMGVLMNEWQHTDRRVVRTMTTGLVTLLMAIILCAFSGEVGL
jgi:DNA-binding FadR family transcriptional regulator